MRLRLRGGEVISQGAYGCFVVPPLRCVGEAAAPAGAGTKLMKQEDAAREYAESQVFRALDPRGLYTATPLQPPCAVDPLALNARWYELQRCRAPNATWALQLPLALGDVYDLTTRAHNGMRDEPASAQSAFVGWMASLGVLLEGLAHFHSQGVYHLDVKAENAVLFSSAGSSRLPDSIRLIDFGLSSTHAQERAKFEAASDAERPPYTWSTPYFVYPVPAALAARALWKTMPSVLAAGSAAEKERVAAEGTARVLERDAYSVDLVRWANDARANHAQRRVPIQLSLGKCVKAAKALVQNSLATTQHCVPSGWLLECIDLYGWAVIVGAFLQRMPAAAGGRDMAHDFYADILQPSALCQLRTAQALGLFSDMCKRHLPAAISAADAMKRAASPTAGADEAPPGASSAAAASTVQPESADSSSTDSL